MGADIADGCSIPFTLNPLFRYARCCDRPVDPAIYGAMAGTVSLGSRPWRFFVRTSQNGMLHYTLGGDDVWRPDPG